MLREQLDESEILFLIENSVKENINLDYKSAAALENTPSKKREISKDVSAFANAAGGKIIYGIRDKKHIPTEIDGTDEIKNKKEWLDQVINSNIHPRIEGINTYHISIKTENKGVLVVNIPTSYTAHQANDNRYYHRYGSESLSMEDYQVRQTMNRGREPILKLEIPPGYQSYPSSRVQIRLKLILKNYGRISANSPEIFIHIPAEISPKHEGEWEERRMYSGKSVPFRTHCKQFYYNWGKYYNCQVHPGLRYEISGERDRAMAISKIIIADTTTLSGYYEIYAENMQPHFGEIKFTYGWNNVNISIVENEALP